MARIAFVLTLLQFGASAATFVQQIFIARVVGATTETDGYQVALAIVVFIAQGLIGTALVNAFVPRLASYSHEEADGSRVFTFWAQINVVAVASVATVAIWITSPAVVSISAAGLSPLGHTTAVDSLRLMVLAIPFAALNGVYTATLYAAGDLSFAAAAQITQNTVAAAFSVIGYSFIGFSALPLSLVIGTIAGSLALFGRLHQRSLVPNRLNTRPSSMGLLGVAVGPFAVPGLWAVPGFVERWFISFFPVGQIAILAYAGRIFSIAMTFGVSLSVVALSRWSTEVGRDGDGPSASTSLSAVRAVVFAVLPATAVLLLMPDIVVQAFFGSSAMSSSQLSLMSFVLAIYSVSLFPVALIGLMICGFYGVGDPNGALRATVIWVVAWVALDVAFIPGFQVVGLAVASVAAVWLAVLVELARGRRDAWLAVWPRVIVSRETLGIAASSAVSVLFASALIRQLGFPLGLALPVLAVAYLLLCAAGGSRVARDVLRVANRLPGVGCELPRRHRRSGRSRDVAYGRSVRRSWPPAGICRTVCPHQV